MLGPKSLGLAMQYNEMREKRWQHQMKEAAVLSGMQQMADPVEAHSAKVASTSKRYAVAPEHLAMLEQSALGFSSDLNLTDGTVFNVSSCRRDQIFIVSDCGPLAEH